MHTSQRLREDLYAEECPSAQVTDSYRGICGEGCQEMSRFSGFVLVLAET